MTQTRRNFLKTSLAGAGLTALPLLASAGSHSSDIFEGSAGAVKVHPINHASLILETPVGVLYVDPVGAPDLYKGNPPADLILITHEHGDHYKEETLAALTQGETQLITNPAVHAKLPAELQAKAKHMGNGGNDMFNGMNIDAIPAYNMTEERKKFHPQGRDNGYVLTIGDFRIYISGDTEDTPEMRALKDIDLAFLCMNLPFTMPVEAAADAVREFKPKNVYPYHYRGRDGGTQDPEEFAKLVGDASAVQLRGWY
ncbi:MAG: MBL fold metallo-hydrolase [Planktotalea sp.]|uniref:MBL fold metallo-hydrolase n=1 Tax=Planktotalea sp. TaxID=2029877 RepID=UPI003C74C16C